MTRRLAGHLARGLVMIWAVSTLAFFVISVMPGDPVAAHYETLLQQGASPDSAAAQTAVMARFRPDGTVWQQYLDYMGSLVQLDLGQSLTNQVPVSDILLDATKWTIAPLLIGTLLSFVLGVTLGVFAAVKRSGKVGDFLAVSSSIVNGVPPFVTALLLAAIFTTLWPVLPRTDAVDISIEPGWSAEYIGSLAEHAVLPIAVYLLVAYGGWVLAMRSSVVTVLGDDFILAAELRGMRKRTVYRYIARNAILPLFTILTISIGTLFSGAVFIERIFNYPGLGMTMLDSMEQRDISVMAGALLMITVAVIVANILADVFYSVIDPRVRRGGETQ